MDFPFIGDTDFPNGNKVNAYKYKNNFDYSKYDSTQMRIELLSVPWDLGSVHVGLKEIIGFGRVVKFENKEERDEWFNSVTDKYSFDTKYRSYNSNDEIKIPLPLSTALRFNYIRIIYSELPVDYETETGVKELFYFIRNAEMLSPSTTLCSIELDAWQTYIYDIEFENILLEQGHYAVANSDVDTYLSDPINNSSLLLSEDINNGDINRVKHSDTTVLNSGSMYALIATTANPKGDWGSKASGDWETPARSYYTVQGTPNVFTFAINAENINGFLYNIDSSIPQFKQTIQALYFVSGNLLTIGQTFDFASTTCYEVTATQKTINNLDLNKSLFNYPEQYEHLAKLYTSPYAHIEVVTDSGKTTVINIEDTNGSIEIKGALSLAYPYLKIDTLISSVGGVSGSVSFKNIDNHSFAFGGRWYEYLNSWDIPTFAVVQDNEETNDFTTYYEREQARTAYTNTYNNAVDSADALVTNTAIQNGANTTMTANSTATASTDTALGNALNQALQAWNAGYSRACASASAEAETQTAAVGVGASVISSAGQGAFSGAMGGGLPGAVGGAIGGAITGLASGVVSGANTAIAINLETAKTEAGISNTQAQVSATNNNNTSRTANSNSNSTSNTATQNSASAGIASNSANVAKGNALRDRNTASSDVQNGIYSANIKAPNTFGTFANGDTATTRPQALFVNVVTQSDNAIKQTGDYFLRYGYMLNQYIEFETFNVMPKFSYWKCSDIWTSGLNIPDAIADKIRFYLLSGVYVFRRPEYITEKNVIYNNK